MRNTIGLIVGLFFMVTASADDFILTAQKFNNQDTIPLRYTCDGDNISPQLNWKNAPGRTRSFVLIVSNPDAPYGTFYNWVLYNLPGNIQGLPEGANNHALPSGTLVGKTSSNDMIYRGPCPPNSAPHHYVFDLYALDSMLALAPGADIDDLLNQVKNHILKQTKLVGQFQH